MSLVADAEKDLHEELNLMNLDAQIDIQATKILVETVVAWTRDQASRS
jgi:hypothetical protein